MVLDDLPTGVPHEAAIEGTSGRHGRTALYGVLTLPHRPQAFTGATLLSPWLARVLRLPAPRVRLLILPHSGAGPAAFRGWERQVPPGVELLVAHLPGRLSRMREAPVREPEVLVVALVEALRPLLDAPLVVLGHSLGARVAQALAHRLRSEGLPTPRALIVSGRRGPSRPEAAPPMHALPRPLFIAELERRYGALDEALRHPELAEMVFPALQADLQLSETWPPERGAPLDLPVQALGGDADAGVGLEDLEAWRTVTTGPFSARLLPGDHFYLLREPERFLTAIQATLLEAMEG